MDSKNRDLSHLDPLLIKALKGFPKFVKKQQASMRKNQATVNRISKAIVKEFKLKGIHPKPV